MTVYWCSFAWLGGEQPDAGVEIRTDQGRIASVRTGVEPSDEATRLQGLTLPGLANTHSHAFHRALRSTTQRGKGSFWTWREDMYEIAQTLTPDTYHLLARAVYGEMALAGITTVGEFHYLHHQAGGRSYDDPNAMGEAMFAAAAEAGIRITLIDTCYLSGGFGAPLSPTQDRFSDKTVSAWKARVGDIRVPEHGRLAVAAHSVRAVDPASIAGVAEFATSRPDPLPLHAHVSEQPLENAECQATYGMTPTRVMASAGALDGDFTAVHATHLTADDINLLSSSESTACFCPTTERDLADGIGPSRSLDEAGVTLALGTDSQAVIDLFEEARAIELNRRLSSGERGHHDAVSLLEMATSNGHEALGWADCGSIAPGAAADFVTVGMNSIRLAGVEPQNYLEAVVFAASAVDVESVVVAGEAIVTGGNHVRFDVVSAMSQALSTL
ncbi:MAG: formimidoylglutamate deiminase [Acidimicrobiia bacterium]|nr:formimidoylglutamate deiminase [Acidimicrobiia bacterium]